MKSIRLLLLPMIAAFFVSATIGQETETRAEKKKDVSKVAKKLHGEWAGDVEKTAEAIKKMDEELEEAMIEMVLDRIGEIELKFNDDGTFDVVFGAQAISGTWEATKVKTEKESKFVVIKTVADEDSGGEEKNFEIHFVGKKNIKMVDIDDGGPPIVLKRVEKEK